MNTLTYNINCEWGLNGINRFKQNTDVFIIIDVLSFSTSVDIATANGAIIFPYKFRDETGPLYSAQVNAALASSERSKEQFSLSPASLVEIKPDTRLVLPSPNGAELSLSTGGRPTLCACLRNARAVASYAMEIGGNITIIPAGEKWSDGSIRFAAEDHIGAGSVISFLKGKFSQEAAIALDTFKQYKDNLFEIISGTVSGVELIERGFPEDVELASLANVSNAIPMLNKNLYQNINNTN